MTLVAVWSDILLKYSNSFKISSHRLQAKELATDDNELHTDTNKIPFFILKEIMINKIKYQISFNIVINFNMS